jgi:hypothetical protein
MKAAFVSEMLMGGFFHNRLFLSHVNGWSQSISSTAIFFTGLLFDEQQREKRAE